MTNELTHAAVRSLLSLDRTLPIDYSNARLSGRLSVRRSPATPEPDAVVQISNEGIARNKLDRINQTRLNVNVQSDDEAPSFKDALAEILKAQQE